MRKNLQKLIIMTERHYSEQVLVAIKLSLFMLFSWWFYKSLNSKLNIGPKLEENFSEY